MPAKYLMLFFLLGNREVPYEAEEQLMKCISWKLLYLTFVSDPLVGYLYIMSLLSLVFIQLLSIFNAI